jgi:drug/metabolite transporter (DMT)-like permease
MTKMSFPSKITGLFILAICIFMGAGAQLLLKFAVLQGNIQPGACFSHLLIFLGLGLYALGTGFWIISLKYLELSYAYPFNMLMIILVIVGSWLLFDDRISPQRSIGILLVCLGVSIAATRTVRNA